MYYSSLLAGRSTVISCSARTSGAVAQQQRGVVERAAHVEPLDLEALRPGVGEKRSDRGVEPLRLAQHDVHQLRLLGRQRQLVAQDLDRPGHRGQRVADLVGDAGGHLPHRRQPLLLNGGVTLQPLDRGHVLEGEEQAGAPTARRFEMGRGQADFQIAAAVERAVVELVAPARAFRPQVVLNRRHCRRRQLQHVVAMLAQSRRTRGRRPR